MGIYWSSYDNVNCIDAINDFCTWLEYSCDSGLCIPSIDLYCIKNGLTSIPDIVLVKFYIFCEWEMHDYQYIPDFKRYITEKCYELYKNTNDRTLNSNDIKLLNKVLMDFAKL